MKITSLIISAMGADLGMENRIGCGINKNRKELHNTHRTNRSKKMKTNNVVLATTFISTCIFMLVAINDANAFGYRRRAEAEAEAAAAASTESKNATKTEDSSKPPAKSGELPCNPNTRVVKGVTYYQCGTAWYTKAYGSSGAIYMPVSPPQ